MAQSSFHLRQKNIKRLNNIYHICYGQTLIKIGNLLLTINLNGKCFSKIPDFISDFVEKIACLFIFLYNLYVIIEIIFYSLYIIIDTFMYF